MAMIRRQCLSNVSVSIKYLERLGKMFWEMFLGQLSKEVFIAEIPNKKSKPYLK